MKIRCLLAILFLAILGYAQDPSAVDSIYQKNIPGGFAFNGSIGKIDGEIAGSVSVGFFPIGEISIGSTKALLGIHPLQTTIINDHGVSDESLFLIASAIVTCIGIGIYDHFYPNNNPKDYDFWESPVSIFTYIFFGSTYIPLNEDGRIGFIENHHIVHWFKDGKLFGELGAALDLGIRFYAGETSNIDLIGSTVITNCSFIFGFQIRFGMAGTG